MNWEYLGSGASTNNLLAHLNWNANDSSWNSNTWSASNITWSDWLLGSWSAIFNGSSSVITYSSTITWTWPATFIAWIKTTQDSSATNRPILAKRDTNNGCITFNVSMWKLLFRDYNWWFGFSPWWRANTVINDDKRHMVAFTRNGLNGKYYVDWEPDGTTTAWVQHTWNTEALRLWLDSNDWTRYAWSIDEVIIEASELSAVQIKKIYTQSKGRFGTL